jgi:hypothetical protein
VLALAMLGFVPRQVAPAPTVAKLVGAKLRPMIRVIAARAQVRRALETGFPCVWPEPSRARRTKPIVIDPKCLASALC